MLQNHRIETRKMPDRIEILSERLDGPGIAELGKEPIPEPKMANQGTLRGTVLGPCRSAGTPANSGLVLILRPAHTEGTVICPRWRKAEVETSNITEPNRGLKSNGGGGATRTPDLGIMRPSL